MIGPVGWGTPPRGSMVTAKFWAAGRPVSPVDSKRARPDVSASKTPAATGLPSAKTHSSYCLSGGSGARLPAKITPVFAFSLQKTFARAEGCGSFPPRYRIRTSSLSSTRTRRSRRAISVRAPESSSESWAVRLRRSSLCRRSRASSQTAKTKRTAAAAASHHATREAGGTAGARSKREPGREARIFSRRNAHGKGARRGSELWKQLFTERTSLVQVPGEVPRFLSQRQAQGLEGRQLFESLAMRHAPHSFDTGQCAREVSSGPDEPAS